MAHDYQILGTHHVELFVGNAKQAAYYYQRAWGFRIVAYQGLETGARDHVSYVLQQDRIRLVLTSPLDPPARLVLLPTGAGSPRTLVDTMCAGTFFRA